MTVIGCIITIFGPLQFFHKKRVVVAYEEQFLQYTATPAGSKEHGDAPQYVCLNVEADIRKVYHLSVLLKVVPRLNTVVHSTDTDVMVILLYHAQKLEADI